MIILHARSYLNRVEKLGGKRRTEKVNYNNGSDTQIIYYRNETPNVSSQTDRQTDRQTAFILER